jgi:probable HAF family extracellular repeat protein
MPLQISDDGSVIVGHAGFDASRTEAFRWEDGEYQLLGDLPGGALNSRAMGVSGDGSIVVGMASTASGMRPFIWDAQHGMRNLADLLTSEFALDIAGMALTQAVGISGDGLQIAGDATNANGRPEAWLADLSCSEGDLNHDGACSLQDVEPLLDCLLTGMPCGCADLNFDNQHDGQDIRSLVDCIVGP